MCLCVCVIFIIIIISVDVWLITNKIIIKKRGINSVDYVQWNGKWSNKLNILNVQTTCITMITLTKK